MPKTKRFQNLQKSVQSASSSQSTDAAPGMTSILAPSFPTTSHPTPLCQATSLPSPLLQATGQQTASFQATTQPRQQALSFQAMGQTAPCIQPTPSFQATSLPSPLFQATGQQTASFQATTQPRQQALSFQAMGQTTPCIQPTPSFQATSLPTPSFQATRQQTASFQATTLPTPSFQATRQTTPSFQATGQPPINPTPAQATSNKRAKRQSSHHWTVDGIDSHGNTKILKLKTREVLSLPQGERVVVEFDCLDPIGEAQGLLAGVCGLLATDCTIFPISFDKWSDMPKSYFNDCFNNIIKAHFCFMTIEEVAREHVYRSIAKKWAASRQKLWDEFKDPLKTKYQIMDNLPVGLTRDQWASFVNYRTKEETQNMCKRNAENRKKQTVPHTGGSKPNARRRAEMMAETGRKPGRAQLYLVTHTKKDGSYVNEEAKEICEKIELAVSESTVDESEISPNDAVGKVLGKEHPGRVRCLGLGATPSNTFRQTNLRPGNIRIVSNNIGCCSSGCQDKYNQLMNTLKAYMIMKEGSIPEQFAGIFASTPTTPRDAASGPVSPRDARRSSSASNPCDSN